MALNPNDLTNAIDSAFQVEWSNQKSIPLPAAGSQDRRLLFAAVARGLLTYLQAHDAEILSSVTMRLMGGSDQTYTVTDTNLNISV